MRAAGLTFDVRVVDADERRLGDESPVVYVARVAALKADGALAAPDEIVIALALSAGGRPNARVRKPA